MDDAAGAPASRAADWLCLAAAPAFAMMAVLTVVFSDDMPVICSSASFPLAGMVPMYLLMSLFHSAPWLKLLTAKQTHRSASKPDRSRRPETPASHGQLSNVPR